MNTNIRIILEKTFFFGLLFFIPFQTRFILIAEPQFLEWTSISLWGTDILLLGLILFWLAQGPKLSLSRSDKILGLFILLTAFSMLGAENRQLGFYVWLRFVEMAVFFYYIEHAIRRYKISLIIGVLVAAGFMQALLGIGQFALQSDLGLSHIETGPLGPWLRGVANFFTDSGKFIRAYGTFPHPNMLAVFLLSAIAITLACQQKITNSVRRAPILLRELRKAWLQTHESEEGGEPSSAGGDSSDLVEFVRAEARERKEWGRVIYFSLLFLLIFALFLTFSRAVILIGSIGLFAFALWCFISRRSDILAKLNAANALLVLVISYALVIGLLWPELKERFRFSRREEAVEFRITSSESAWAIIKKHPFGVGPGNYIPHIRRFVADAPRRLPADGLQPVHNLYLLLASEIGLPAFLTFVAFLGAVVSSFWRTRLNLRWPLVIFLFVVGVLALVDHYFLTLQQGRLLWWLGWGIIAAYGSKDREPAKSQTAGFLSP